VKVEYEFITVFQLFIFENISNRWGHVQPPGTPLQLFIVMFRRKPEIWHVYE